MENFYNYQFKPSIKDYKKFLISKGQLIGKYGFKPLFMPDFLFDFQLALVEWAIEKGKSALFADTGLGKTPMQLVWAQNIVQKTNKPVLIVTPLGVSAQTLREAEKFGIDAIRSKDGTFKGNRVIVTNYERLHYFDPEMFAGVVCDESSAIKNLAGKRQKIVIDFMKSRQYRLLCTATAAPNDYVELGTSAEALGELGKMDMLSMFFKSDDNTLHPGTVRYDNIWIGAKWRFKAHSEDPFWKWVSSWARAIRKPSDLGFDDTRFILPKLIENEHSIQGKSIVKNGQLFSMPAKTLNEQRDERRFTINDRCNKVAELVNHKGPAVVWGHLNQETDLLEKIIPGSKQVNGSMDDDEKEETFLAFSTGQLRVLITKPKIGAFGLNWQHCNHMTFFPSHSFEQYYQGVRRCWRYGQKKPVTVDIVTSEGEAGVMRNLQRKMKAAEKMFDNLIKNMHQGKDLERNTIFSEKTEVPNWLA